MQATHPPQARMDVHRLSCIEWMTDTAADAHTDISTATALLHLLLHLPFLLILRVSLSLVLIGFYLKRLCIFLVHCLRRSLRVRIRLKRTLIELSEATATIIFVTIPAILWPSTNCKVPI